MNSETKGKKPDASAGAQLQEGATGNDDSVTSVPPGAFRIGDGSAGHFTNDVDPTLVSGDVEDPTAITAYVAGNDQAAASQGPIVVEGVKESDPGASNTLILGISTFLGAIALIVGLSVGLGQDQAEVIVRPVGTFSPSTAPSVPILPTEAPTVAPTSELFIDVIDQLTFEFPDLQIIGDSVRAARWMATDNFFELPISENQTLSRLEFRQRFAMANFFYATNKSDEGWIDDCNFLSSEHICNWTCPLAESIIADDLDPEQIIQAYGFWPPGVPDKMGVACELGRIAAGIQIVENGLSGTIPIELQAINFPGVIEPFQVLSLGSNELTGTIPYEAFRARDPSMGMRYLYLFSNQLTGEIPTVAPEILPNVVEFHLLFNQLSGSLPSTMAAMTSLRSLWLNNNAFSGSLEETGLLEIPSCRALTLYSNQLTGSIPEIVLQANATTDLRILDLDDNLLTGRIPQSFEQLTSLVQVLLSRNMLTGPLPENIGDITNLDLLDISNNALTSTLPSSLSTLTNFFAIDVQENLFTGTPLQDKIFHEMSGLAALRIGRNKFSGPLDFSANWTDMINFSLLGADFTGTIPTEIGLLTNTRFLFLGLNDLTGTLPTELDNLVNLQALWVHGLNVSGNLNQLCDKKVNDISGGYIADCLEPEAVECSCCTECCDKALVGDTTDLDIFEMAEAICRVV